MSKFLFVAVALLAIGCQVKKRETPGGQAPAIAAGELPIGLAFTRSGKLATGKVFNQESATSRAQGLFVSRTGRFLISASNVHFVPREDNTIYYRLATSDLAQVSLAEYQLQIEYDMPSMTMEGLTLSMKPLADGRIEVTYEGIAHGGEWEVRFKILHRGQIVDNLSYRVRVPNR